MSYERPATWQEEEIAVQEAFGRSGVKRTQPDDEPDQIIPMVNAMADEIARLRDTVRRFCEPMPAISTLTDAERDAIERVIPGYEMAATNEGDPELAKIAATLRGLLKRTK